MGNWFRFKDRLAEAERLATFYSNACTNLTEERNTLQVKVDEYHEAMEELRDAVDRLRTERNKLQEDLNGMAGSISELYTNACSIHSYNKKNKEAIDKLYEATCTKETE